ncbi:hypothetical protein QWY20_09300 [Alkalimonas sp. MEB108]|uniref:Uncharacterized protein n=1 Tax=Alkalimonas cellulosilytica TaxID=3058395 RepID=A0ABU7J5C2_9GAMM|nr:hypothetical protein [Alkalimonas sp. MEB108]MEE2001647.1 hypothetical protein [Alkalimonas sp. MEB108]
MKKLIDVQSELKTPQAAVRLSKMGRQDKDEKILDIPLTCESSRKALKELMSDVRFVSGHNVSPLIAFEMLLHYWLMEIKRAPRAVVAVRLNSARKFAHKMRQHDTQAANAEYEAIADRLLNALSEPRQADEGISNA